MSDNPFDEPEDADRTLVRGPSVPRSSAGVPRRALAARGPLPGAAPALAAGAEAVPRIGIGPLAAAAAPLLEIQARLVTAGARASADPSELRERVLRGFRQFETEAHATGATEEELREAHYILCAAIDDVVLSTRWGADSLWGTRSLGSTFHHDVRSGEHVFDRLALMQREPGRFRGALEVGCMALALGLQGRYRTHPRGPAELDKVREGLFRLLQTWHGQPEPDLSPQWRGVDAPNQPPAPVLPAWAAAPAAALLLGLGWFWLTGSLGDGAAALEARLAALPPLAAPQIQRAAPPVPPALAPPPPARADAGSALRRFLQPEIAAGLVSVESDAQRLLVRLGRGGLFASGSATPQKEFESILARIGEALREEAGSVAVVGHTDNQPIRTVRFRSNAALSLARAEAVLSVIAAANGEAGRFRAEGRGEAEPIASNATPGGREANRRIEILLLRGRG